MGIYEIKIKEYLDTRWQKYFEGFELSHTATSNTLLRGVVQDRSKLQAILNKLFSLNLTLLEMHCRASTELSQDPSC